MTLNTENMDRIVAWRRKHPEDFDMRVYAASADGHYLPPPPRAAECGTVTCFIGSGPAAGIAPLAREGWATYSERVSGLKFFSPKWQWLFSGGWAYTDNTVEGACLRYEWLRDKGLPDNWADQMLGHAPLCYVEAGNGR